MNSAVWYKLFENFPSYFSLSYPYQIVSGSGTGADSAAGGGSVSAKGSGNHYDNYIAFDEQKYYDESNGI